MFVASTFRKLRNSLSLRDYIRWVAGLTAAALAPFVCAQTSLVSPEKQQALPPVLEEVGDAYQNSIVLLSNRFRIDHEVDEITLIFFRKFGSAPVVLVRPDGSKIFQSRAEEEGVEWFDDDTYDMVKIPNPVPGPWQAVGQILPESRVMVVSELELHADSLPNPVFSGEVLKQTAYLTNGGKPIDYSQFREVVNLSLELKSTNNPDFDNFGAKDELIAEFEDNGRGMDEKPRDGIFSGQFNLTIPAGEWTPIFTVKTPMFSREQVDPILILHPNPIKVDVILDDGEEGYHQVLIDVVREQLDINALLIDGEIRFPNGDVQNFSITEPSDNVRIHRILAYEEGVFRVNLTAYGKTLDGRDIILDVPEYTFFGEVKTAAEDEAAETTTTNVSQDAETVAQPEIAPLPPEEESMKTSTLILLLGIVNGSIVVVGAGFIAVVMWRRKKANRSGASVSETSADTAIDGKKLGLVGKLVGRFKKKKTE